MVRSGGVREDNQMSMAAGGVGVGSHLIKEREKEGLGGKTFGLLHSCKRASTGLMGTLQARAD